MDIIEIDGGIGYGQVLRTAIALSALTLKPIRIYNIRKSRPKPGLRPQHLKGVQIAGKLVHADIQGLKIGSMEVIFIPKRFDIPKEIFVDIGTAGSVTLLLQTLIPILIFSDHPVKLRIIGGTDTKGAPTSGYYFRVFFHYLRKFGVNIRGEIKRYGFYPRGGGEVFVEIHPAQKLQPVKITERGKLQTIEVWSIASLQLKKAKVAERQIKGFKENFPYPISNESFAYVDSDSIGTSLLAIATYENCKLGEDGLGKKGKRAEDVGKDVASGLVKSIDSSACLDKYMADQILPFMALASGKSEVTVESITDHVETNMAICEKMIGVEFEVKGNRVSVEGIGFSKAI